MNGTKDVIPIGTRVAIRRLISRLRWPFRGFPAPAPQHVKLAVLGRYGYPRGLWVESGTFLGDTTRVLAKTAVRVYTIEPSIELAERAIRRFRDRANVEVIQGLSEDVFPALLPTLSGTISFWLDGHTSGGMTHSGPQATPIREELAAIEENLDRYGDVAVAVDDFRGFPSGGDANGAAYPGKSTLVEWADRNRLKWTVEQDIFVAWRGSPE